MRIIRVNDFYVVINEDDSPLLHFGDSGERLSDDDRYDIITQYCKSEQTAQLEKEINHATR